MVTLPQTKIYIYIYSPCKNDGWKMSLLLRKPIFRCYVNFGRVITDKIRTLFLEGVTWGGWGEYVELPRFQEG